MYETSDLPVIRTVCTGLFFWVASPVPITGTIFSLSDILHNVGNLGMSLSISGFGIPIQLDSRSVGGTARAAKTGFALIRRQRRFKICHLRTIPLLPWDRAYPSLSCNPKTGSNFV